MNRGLPLDAAFFNAVELLFELAEGVVVADGEVDMLNSPGRHPQADPLTRNSRFLRRVVLLGGMQARRAIGFANER